MNGNTVHKSEITILGTLDESGTFCWTVDPDTLIEGDLYCRHTDLRECLPWPTRKNCRT